jgi:ubiquinone/menaquinone biosynthesis C-methylase UbiE
MAKSGNTNNCNVSFGWHACWEENIYNYDLQLNRYPFDGVVSYVYKNYRNVLNRNNIKVMELGFGAGNNLWFMAREGFTVAGIEGSKTAVKFAKQRFRRNGLIGDLRVGDFSELPWKGQSFDLIIDRGALTHNTYESIKITLKEVKRVLKKNGKLLSILLFSDLHPDRKYGHKIDKSTYDKIKKGPLKGLGRTHFASLNEIKELFGSILKINSITHMLEEDCLKKPKIPINAYWKIECENK